MQDVLLHPILYLLNAGVKDVDGNGDDDGDSEDACGIGSVFIYSCVSSA